MRTILLALAIWSLAACASAPEPVSVVPADLQRGPCRPPADLMVRPTVPRIVPGEPMAERAARDGTALTTMARDFAALQLWITDTCS